MIAKFKCSLAVVLLTFLFSCGSSDSEPDLYVKNEKADKDLALKYSADTTWNIAAHYSFDFQEMFIKTNKLMLFKGKIYDIIFEDSTYFIKVLDERNDVQHYYIAFIKFNSYKVASFFKENKSTRGAFIIKVSKVTCSIPSIKEDEERSGEDTYYYTHLNDDADNMVQIFNGELIDFRLYEIEKNN